MENQVFRKRVLLLASSCKRGGLCPGGLDLDNPSKWIRIVKDDGDAGAVQGYDIDFAEPLDILEFEGYPVPLGKQKENWAIVGKASKVRKRFSPDILYEAYQRYCYHDFRGSFKSYLTEEEFIRIDAPTESMLLARNLKIYKNEYEKFKIDFSVDVASGGVVLPLFYSTGVSLTDRDYYGLKESITIEKAYLVVAIPKDLICMNPPSQEKRAYKFVSKIYPVVFDSKTGKYLLIEKEGNVERKDGERGGD